MAYEASEIMTAVALQSSAQTLNKVKTQGDLQKLITDGIKIVIKGKNINVDREIVVAGNCFPNCSL